MKPVLMILLLIGGGAVSLWSTVMLALAPTVGHFVLSAAGLCTGLLLVYIAMRVSRSL